MRWNLVNNWNINEKQSNIQDHPSPVTIFITGRSNSQQDNNHHANENACIWYSVIEPNSTSVAPHHNSTQIKSVLELPELNFLVWKRRLKESFFWVGGFVLWNDVGIVDEDVIGLSILWNIINLLGFTTHERMSCWDVTHVQPWHIFSGEHVFFRSLQESTKFLN